MEFNPNTWGTVSSWVSGGATALAFATTTWVLYRDAKVRRECQARKVAYHFQEVNREPSEVRGKYTKWWDLEVHNLSDEPIYRIQHHHRVASMRIPMHLRFHEVLLPGQNWTVRRERYPSKSRFDIQFVDNSGRIWVRTLKGDLREFRPFIESIREIFADRFYGRRRLNENRMVL